jgi:DNA-binding Lrp family transcriptional regulator
LDDPSDDREEPDMAEQVVQLDAVDHRMIAALRADGRASVNELAGRVNVSRATAYARLARLRQSGVIRRFTVDVDHRRLGLPIAALVLVSVVQHSWRGVGDRLRHLPGVEWLALSSGSFDYVLLVRAPDIDHLRDVILEDLQSIPEIQSSQTLVLLDEPPVPDAAV